MKKEKSFWVAVFAGFIVLAAGDILIHRVWLRDLYDQLAQFWRPAAEMQARAWLPFLSEFALAFLLAHIYPMGYEKGAPAGEGLRFGILMGLLIYLPATLMKYYVYPFPNYLFIVWFLRGVGEVALAGLAIALAYKQIR